MRNSSREWKNVEPFHSRTYQKNSQRSGCGDGQQNKTEDSLRSLPPFQFRCDTCRFLCQLLQLTLQLEIHLLVSLARNIFPPRTCQSRQILRHPLSSCKYSITQTLRPITSLSPPTCSTCPAFPEVIRFADRILAELDQDWVPSPLPSDEREIQLSRTSARYQEHCRTIQKTSVISSPYQFSQCQCPQIMVVHHDLWSQHRFACHHHLHVQ